jgi:hypothetical protein
LPTHLTPTRARQAASIADKLEKSLEEIDMQTQTLDSILDRSVGATVTEDATEAVMNSVRTSLEMADSLPSAPSLSSEETDLEERLRKLMET